MYGSIDGFGRAVTVEELEVLERNKVRDQLRNVRPELLAEGVRVMKAKLDADNAFEVIQKAIHGAVGGGAVRVAIDMMIESARAQIAQEKLKTSRK